MNADEFRRLGHALVNWIAAYREEIEARPVMSRVQPGEIRARLPRTPPERGGGTDELLAVLDRDVMPGITHWNHPAFFAYFPSNTSYASILGDLACAGLGVQGMSWQTSPAATEIEEVVMDWLRQMLGLSDAWTGVIQDTASTATLGALICARERATCLDGRGLQGTGPTLVVYASAQAHSSIDKAVVLAGFGKTHLRSIPTDERYAMRVDALRAAIEADRAAGLTPCAIVATAGTTNTTAFDPIAEIAEVAERHGAWLHVDAAMAGTAMILPECRRLWDGVERADSVVLNPHKWMGPGFDLSAYYCRDPQHLIRVMGTNPSYLRTAQDGEVPNFRDWHIQLGRRFRALKLWFYLLDTGVEGVRARLRRDLANARWLAEQVAAAPGWELAAPVTIQTVCLRHATADVAAIARRINEGGRAYLTPSTVDGKSILRVSIGAERTERRHVEALWADLRVSRVADLSITALYTSATWRWGGLSYAHLFATREAKRVFDATNAVLAVAGLLRRDFAPLRHSLVHRHLMIDRLLADSGCSDVIELAAGLSRRGAAVSSDPAMHYVELDLPPMVHEKRELLGRTAEGRGVLARANLELVEADVETADLGTWCPRDRPVFVIAEGLLMYLDAAAQRSLFARVAALADIASDVRFAFDLVPGPEQPPPGRIGRALESVMKRFTGGRGFTRDTRTRADILRELAAVGFVADALTPRDIATAWQLPHAELPTQTVVFTASRATRS